MGHLYIAKLFIVYCVLVYAQCQFTKDNTYAWILRTINAGFLLVLFCMFLSAINKSVYIPAEETTYYISDDDIAIITSTSSSCFTDSDSESELNFVVQTMLPRRNPYLPLSMRGITLERQKNNLVRQSHDFCGYKYSKTITTAKFCAFCQENGEPEYKYRNHNLKDRYQRCTCPILQLFVCPVCRGTGLQAHTVQYCPYLQTRSEFEVPVDQIKKSVVVKL